MEFLEQHSYEYIKPSRYDTPEAENQYFTICDHVNAAAYLFVLYEWECYKLMNHTFKADKERSIRIINSLNAELQLELGRMFNHIFDQIYVPRVGNASWKPESLRYIR